MPDRRPLEWHVSVPCHSCQDALDVRDEPRYVDGCQLDDLDRATGGPRIDRRQEVVPRPGQVLGDPQRIVAGGMDEGAARSEAVRRIAPQIFGVPVTVPSPAEYVALGAARQAAWALSGAAEPPTWPLPGTSAECSAAPTPEVHAQYASLRDATAGWG